MSARVFLVVASVLMLASVAGASPVIFVGNHTLDTADPDTWTIPIYVSGGDQVSLCSLFVQVGDGGPTVGGTSGPVITNVDLTSGIFAPSDPVQLDLGSIPQVALYSVETDSGTVAADGLLGTIVFDPTSFADGTWDLKLSNTIYGSTNFGAIPAQITDGTVTIVPEPLTATLLLAGAALAFRKRRPLRQ